MLAEFHLRARLAVIVLALGCHGDDAPDRFPEIEGGVCSSQSEPRCAGPDSIFTCVSRSWVELACTDVCADEGLVLSAEGCVPSEDYRRDWCICEPIDDSCGTCESTTSIVVCEDGQLTSTECANVCAGLDPPRASDGCDDSDGIATCSCTLAGTPCDADDTPRCDDRDMLASCMDGAWVIGACADGCNEAELGYCKASVVDEELVDSCICLSSH
jgi:hypothetical protein